MATLSITFTINDAQEDAVKADFAAHFGWTATVVDPVTREVSPNPVTRNQFIKSTLADFIRDAVRAQRADTASENARLASIADTEANVSIE